MTRSQPPTSLSRWIGCLALVALATLVVAPAEGAQAAGKAAPKLTKAVESSRAFDVARRYTVRFYPRWFTWRQAKLSLINRMVGPDRVSPIWGIVVAPNDDTIYTTSLLNLKKEPQVLTIPATDVTYSLLTLDVFGNIFETKVKVGEPGTYALVGPDWQGDLPEGLTPIRVPYNASEWIIRADKYSAAGVDQIVAAHEFRRNLALASLSDYEQDPAAGKALIVPEEFYGPRVKVMADTAIETQPTHFLSQMQRAVHSPQTEPFTDSDHKLSKRFDRLFDGGGGRTEARIILGAQVAHTQIVDRWQSHTGDTNWVYFDNIGDWGNAYLDRAALTQYIQLGNGAQTAGYYDAFVNHRGVPLDASVSPGYVLTFPAGEIPQAQRFWSLTAYLPESVTLVPNSADKYVVGSYTPGLETNADGSVSIYMQPERPVTVPEANWLPVPDGPFNVLLRIYGPTGNTAPGAGYAPPGIRETFRH